MSSRHDYRNHHRETLEQVAQAAVDGIGQVLGQNTEIGLHGHFEDDEVTSRALPLRAALVSFAGPLHDVVIGISSMPQQQLEAAMASIGMAIARSFGEGSNSSAPELHTYEEREQALEQLDALWDEPTVHFATPMGDLLLVVGKGLLASIDRINGRQQFDGDEADGPMFVANTVQLKNEGSFTDEYSIAAAAAAKFAAQEPQDNFAHATAGVAGRASEVRGMPGGLGEADIDAMLTSAADVGAVAPQAAGRGGAHAAPLTDFSNDAAHRQTAAANAMASSGANQWAELLSGVDVDITAELGRTSMRLGDVTSLVDDCVLTLDQLVDEPVTVFVNGSLYASARLVVVDGQYGIEVVEVFEPGRAPVAVPMKSAVAA